MIVAGKEYQLESKTGLLNYGVAKAVNLKGIEAFNIAGYHFTGEGTYLRQTPGFCPSWVEGDQFGVSDVDPYRKQAWEATSTLKEIQALTKTLLSGSYGDTLSCGLASEEAVAELLRIKTNLESIKNQLQSVIEEKTEFPELD